MFSAMLWDLFVVAVFVIWGGIFYVIDDRLGTAIYAFFYKLTHKEGLLAGVKRGYISGRSTESRIWWSIGLGIIAFYFIHATFATTILGNILIFFVAICGTFIGFLAGPLFVRLWAKKSRAIKAIESIEKGEVNFVDEARQAATNLAHNATETLSGLGNNLTGAITGALEEASKHLPATDKTEPTPNDEPPIETETDNQVEAESAPPEINEHDRAKSAIDEFNKRNGS